MASFEKSKVGRKISLSTISKRLHIQELEASKNWVNITCQGPQPSRPSGEGHKKCGSRRAIHNAYKCYYCGFWFCENCAPIHFGKTRAQFIADKQA